MREREERDQKRKEQQEARFLEEQRLINAERKLRAASKVLIGLTAGAAIGLVGDRSDSSRSQPRRKTMSYSSSSLEDSESDLGEGSRWRRGSEETEDEGGEVMSEEQAERLMNAYLDTFTIDEDDQ